MWKMKRKMFIETYIKFVVSKLHTKIIVTFTYYIKKTFFFPSVYHILYSKMYVLNVIPIFSYESLLLIDIFTGPNHGLGVVHDVHVSRSSLLSILFNFRHLLCLKMTTEAGPGIERPSARFSLRVILLNRCLDDKPIKIVPPS